LQLGEKNQKTAGNSHNPKVGGSNPSPAIEGRLNKPPFLYGLQRTFTSDSADQDGPKTRFI
jgi:hypothetical protein